MKVLISAYACQPGEGSEPGAGWAWARAAAHQHDVWVLTRRNNQQAIEAALATDPTLRLHPVYLDLPRWACWWKRGGRGVRLYYCLWQVLARRTAKRLHAADPFDVAHHVTFASDGLPAGVVGVPGLPAVWGPVGGAAPFPRALVRWLGTRGLVQEVTRTVLGSLGRASFGALAAQRAQLVVAQNDEVAARFRRHRPVTEPNVALDEGTGHDTLAGRGERSGEQVALFAGRLVASKGILLAVAALAEPEAAHWRMMVLGDGPARRRAERLATRLGVRQRVEFLGWVPRDEVLVQLRRCDAFLLPSMHDSAGWALGEAAIAGLPLVALDVGGPATILRLCDGGVLVSPHERTVPDLARALNDARPCTKADRLSAARLGSTLTGWYERARTSLPKQNMVCPGDRAVG